MYNYLSIPVTVIFGGNHYCTRSQTSVITITYLTANLTMSIVLRTSNVQVYQVIRLHGRTYNLFVKFKQTRLSAYSNNYVLHVKNNNFS